MAALFVTCLVLLVALLFARKNQPANIADSLNLIGNRLKRMDELSQGVENLTHLFLIPHARGGLAESLLAELLSTWLPKKAFELQYRFRNGNRVDAVVRLGDYLVPVDAKFPLETFRESLEKQEGTLSADAKRAFIRHLTSISEKYIHPDEGTLKFALMYLPSEKIFYYAFVQDDNDLLQEALKLGVVPVSPSSLFLYLQTVAYGLKGFAFPDRQRELVQLLSTIRNELLHFVKAFGVTGTHLKNVQKSYDDSYRRLAALEQAIDRFESGSSDALEHQQEG